MKKLTRLIRSMLVSLLALLIFQFSAFADYDSSNQVKSLSGFQVFGGFAILVLVILLPLLKKESKKEIL
jgi:hypothetical protein